MKVIGTRAGSKGTFPVDTIDVRSMTRLSTNVRASSGYHGRLINSADNRSKQTHGFESNTADPWPIVFTLTRTSHTLLSLKLFLIRLRQIRNSSIERNFSRLYRFIYIYIFVFFFLSWKLDLFSMDSSSVFRYKIVCVVFYIFSKILCYSRLNGNLNID